jgi:lipoyl(octanoyl) transferase
MDSVWLVNLQTVPYAEGLLLQHRLVTARKQGKLRDTLLLLEHPPVFTLGRNAREEHILASREFLEQIGIEVYHVERGGDVTYHGPRQLVGYPILDLHNFRMDVGWYVRSLEDLLMNCVKAFDLDSQRLGDDVNPRDPKLVGVWIKNPTRDTLLVQMQPYAKIAQIGARIERWITYHGFALNVDPIMEHFDFIVPCGIPDKPVSSLALALGHPVEMNLVRAEVAHQFELVFDAHIEELGAQELESRLQETVPA